MIYVTDSRTRFKSPVEHCSLEASYFNQLENKYLSMFITVHSNIVNTWCQLVYTAIYKKVYFFNLKFHLLLGGSALLNIFILIFDFY